MVKTSEDRIGLQRRGKDGIHQARKNPGRGAGLALYLKFRIRKLLKDLRGNRPKKMLWQNHTCFRSGSPNFSSVMTAPRNENMEKRNIRHNRFAVTAPTVIPLLKTSIVDTAV